MSLDTNTLNVVLDQMRGKGGSSTSGKHHSSKESINVGFGFDLLDARLVATAFVAVLLYDHLLTLQQEVDGVWKRKKSPVAIMFLANRYLVPVFYVFVVFSLINPDLTWTFCNHDFVFPPIIIVASETIIGTLFMLRTKALWQDTLNYIWLTLVVVLFSVQFIASIWTAMTLKAAGPFTQYNMGCTLYFPQNEDSTIRLAIYWLCNISFNVAIFLCTLRKTLVLRAAGSDLCLVGLLQRDGTVYFVILLIVKLTNLGMLLLYPEWNVMNWAFNHIFDVIMTSHLLLNLRIEAHPIITINECIGSLRYEDSPEFRTFPSSLARIGTNSTDKHEVMLVGPDGESIYLPSPLVGSPSTLYPNGRSPVQPSVEWMLHALYEVLGEEDYARVMRAAGRQPPPRRNATFTAGQQRETEFKKFDPEAYLSQTV